MMHLTLRPVVRVVALITLVLSITGCPDLFGSDDSDDEPDGSTGAVATPAFSPDGGDYDSAQTVSLETTTDGAIIYYTFDGTDPTSSSPRYTDPFDIESTKTVKAIATKDGMEDSSVASATYTISTASSGGSSASEAIELTLGEWTTKRIDADSKMWFIANVTAGSTYRISWDDGRTIDGSSVDIGVDAYHSDARTPYFTKSDLGDGTNDDTTYKDIPIAPGDSTVYLVADSGRWSTTDDGNFRIRIALESDESEDPSTLRDGSIARPVDVSLNSPYSGKAGSISSGEYESYYTFTTTAAGEYSMTVADLDPSDADLDYMLYNNSLFSESVASESNDSGLVDQDLAAETTYFLEVTNYDASDVTYSLEITAGDS